MRDVDQGVLQSFATSNQDTAQTSSTLSAWLDKGSKVREGLQSNCEAQKDARTQIQLLRGLLNSAAADRLACQLAIQQLEEQADHADAGMLLEDKHAAAQLAVQREVDQQQALELQVSEAVAMLSKSQAELTQLQEHGQWVDVAPLSKAISERQQAVEQCKTELAAASAATAAAQERLAAIQASINAHTEVGVVQADRHAIFAKREALALTQQQIDAAQVVDEADLKTVTAAIEAAEQRGTRLQTQQLQAMAALSARDEVASRAKHHCEAELQANSDTLQGLGAEQARLQALAIDHRVRSEHVAAQQTLLTEEEAAHDQVSLALFFAIRRVNTK